MSRSTLFSLLTLAVLLTTLLGWPLPTAATEPAVTETAAKAANKAFEPIKGTHYDVLTPPVPRSGTKPEVVEVFNFKCPHCYHLFPKMVAWMKKNGDRYQYKALPIFWGKQTDMPLRAYFAADFLGKGEAMKAAIFDAQFKQGADIENPGDLVFLAEDMGLDGGKFQSYLKSFGVSAKVTQARALQRDFGVHSTPTLVINGQYKITPGKHARGDDQLLFRIIEALASR